MKRIIWLVVLGVGLGAPLVWSSEESPHVSVRQAAEACMCDASDELRQVADSIRGGATVDEARRLATQPTSLAGDALQRARWLVPGGSEDLERAYRRIRDYEARVGSAATSEQIASEFESMFLTQRAAIGPPVAADVGDGDGCDFSTGEIIAIVLGFIFGILPGIILLILLC